MKQKKPRILAAVLLCLLAVGVLFGVYVGDYYHADAAAEAALLSDDSVTVTQENGSWVFAPDTPTAGLIFYPGGKVENTAYAPLLHKLANKGILCVLVKMPCNLAVLDMNAADGIPEDFPEVNSWYIGGHSLGGAMAVSYAAKHTDELDGLVLLAAYSTTDLTGSPSFTQRARREFDFGKFRKNEAVRPLGFEFDRVAVAMGKLHAGRLRCLENG